MQLRRTVLGVCAAAAWWLVSCRDIPAPEGGVHSISQVILASPGLVAGDTLRDSLGLIAPLQLIAYGLDNQPLDPQPEPTFVVLDTGAFLADGRYLVGEDAGTTVRVIGGIGTLQTLPVSLKVTLRPEILVAPDTVLTVTFNELRDTVANATLVADVLHQSTTVDGVEAQIVRYEIEKGPTTGTNDGSAAFLLLNGTRLSTRDTTDANGRVSLVGRLRVHAMPPFAEDTVIVRATAAYRGVSLGTIPFIIVYRVAQVAP